MFVDHDHDAVHMHAAAEVVRGFELSPEQKMLRDAVRELAEHELSPRAAQIDREAAFPRENIAQLANQGLLGLVIPHLYGGIVGLSEVASDSLTTAMVCQEMAKGCPSTTLVFLTHTIASYALVAGGSLQLKANYLPDMAQGAMLGAFAVTEPNSGANPLAIETTAHWDGKNYTVNGTKAFITSGGEAEVYITLVRTDPQVGPLGLSLLLIDKKTPGFSVGRKEDRVGLRGTSSAEVVFENCLVPRDNLVGDEGGYMKLAPTISGLGLLGAGAMALGIAEQAYEAAVKRVKERAILGQPLAQNQGIQFIIAEMATKISAARTLVYSAAFERDAGAMAPPLEGLKAKLFATETALEVTDRAIQLHGSYGYNRDLPLERLWRDARGLALHFSPSEFLKDYLGKMLLGLLPGVAAPAHEHGHPHRH